MSTRSGKRIHGSFNDDANKMETELAVRSERKTRSKQMKENINQFNSSLLESKKRKNYVSYPTDDENLEDTGNASDSNGTNIIEPHKSILKEQNKAPIEQLSETSHIASKQVRITRRTKQIADDVTNNANDVENGNIQQAIIQKIKKSKNKSINIDEPNNIIESLSNKKRSKKKKGKKSNSFSTEVSIHQKDISNAFNHKNKSVDSFHSVVGSPIHHAVINNEVNIENSEVVNADNIPDEAETKIFKKDRKKLSKLKGKNKINVNDHLISDGTDSFIFCKEHNIDNSLKELKTGLQNSLLQEQASGNQTSSSLRKSKSTIMNSTYDKEIVDKTSQDIEYKKGIVTDSVLDDNGSGIENNDVIDINEEQISALNSPNVEMNSTIKNNSLKKDSKVSSATPETLKQKKSSTQYFELNKNHLDIPFSASPKLNTTFDKKSISPINMNLTFDMNSKICSPNSSKQDTKSILFDTTLDIAKIIPKTPESKKKRIETITKSSQKRSGRKSIFNNSPIFYTSADIEDNEKSNATENVTHNKSKSLDMTFDRKSKIDTTFDKDPKSSLVAPDSSSTKDLSRISITSDDSSVDLNVNKPSNDGLSKEFIMNTTPVLIESSIDETLPDTDETPVKEVVATPLKREGTFTKDTPEVFGSKSPGESLEMTPNRRKSLFSPGSTPFPGKSSQKDKFPLNVTRSIEKSQSLSMAEPVSRSTKVMFCSPVDDPGASILQKRKVIKSNLKGSKKSFIFEDSGSITRVVPRKRSFTQNDADDANAKRKRLGDEMQQSVDRLSRPRTSSAIVKSREPSTPSKILTPFKPKSDNRVTRKKLPNFAMLHQKQFDRMESLDECQERKAKRARQLLTPTGAVPDTKSPTETQRDVEKTSKEKKTNSSKPAADPKPGYTRFGFKLNLDANPFSIPSKTEGPKTVDSKPKGVKRELTFPSLSGATSGRREMAKQVVMREKSFTDKRSVKRNENRTIIKGVRTNRRFELQMRLRNIE